MKTHLLSFISGILLALATPVLAAEPDTLTRLDEALKSCASYEYGKNAQPLRTVEQIVVESVKNPQQRGAVETRLLTALAGNASRDGKEFLCRQLFFIGTPKCVPRLETMLTDPALAHMARYVLGRLEFPEASAALYRALGKTSGKLQVGIITTLGERRYEKAIPELAKLLASGDPAVASAAATALGKIGGADALKGLQRSRGNAPAPLAAQIDDALLACADHLLASGRDAQAAEVYRNLYSTANPKHLRIAALRGLVSVRNADATKLLVEAIKGQDSDVAAGAIGFSRLAQGAAATKALADLVPNLPPQSQELLITALGARGDRAALPSVIAASRSGNESVRIAALDALGTIGDGSAVEPLLRAAATGSTSEAPVARASLARLSGADVDPALIRALAAGEPKPRVEAVRALAKRKSTAAVQPVLKLAGDDDASVRAAAIRALGDLAAEPDLASMVALLVTPKDAGDRAAIEGAIETAFRRVPAPDKQAAPVLAALGDCPVEARPALLQLLGRTGTPAALAAVRAALTSENGSVREAAVRTLADWPDAAPADELLGLARSLSEPTQKLIALRGYVRMAGLSKDQAAMYARAMELAQRPEDKRLVLAGLGTASSADALQLVEQYLADESLQAEAAMAATQICDQLRNRDAARARTALKKVIAIAKDPRVRQKAVDLLNEVDQFQDHILTWLGAGPFKQEGKDAEALFAMPFPPEQPDAKDVQWKPITRGVGEWSITLDDAMGGGDDLAGYARTRVWSTAAQSARLELGSDDGIKVWLNGKVVHANYVNRGLAPRQDIVKVTLNEGWNDLLLKIVNRGGGWGFSCRVRQPDGTAMEGLKVEAK